MNTVDNKTRVAEIAAKITGETIRASGIKIFLAALANDLIDTWVLKGGIRRKVASPVKWIVSKALKPNGKPSQKVIAGDVGKLITLFAATVNESHSKNSPDQSLNRGESIKAFLENTDFGEIMEMVEGSDPYVLKTLEAFNEQLWKYPAKVGTLVATIIPFINMAIKGSREIMVPIEKAVGPDLLADIILSLIKGINGADTAKLINTLREVIRRIHTGSLLLGKGGKPLLQIYLTDLLKDCLSEMKPELAKKIRIIFAEDRETIAHAVSDALSDNPSITLAYLSSMGSVKTSDIKSASRKLHIVEDLDQDSLNAAVSESMSDLDTYEIAGIINTACRVLNRIHDAKPDFLSNLVSGVMDSVSIEEARNTTKWLIPDMVEAIKPLATAVMPALIKGLSDLISPDQGFENTEHQEAMKSLMMGLPVGGER
jgi:hypothetical protein